MTRTLVPGAMLADVGWLGERVTQLGRSWDCDRRVAGTLWWYMAVSTLLRDPVAALTRGSTAPDPSLARMTCTLRADGGLDDVAFTSTAESIDAAGAALRGNWQAVLPALAQVSGASQQSLWAVASDALGNHALAAGRRDVALELARVIGPELPPPRFVEVSGRAFVRRTSCCLIFETGRADKCISCPRWTPEQRAGLLGAQVDPGR